MTATSVATADALTATSDGQNLVLRRLLAAHEAWFDVTPDYQYAGKTFGGYAEFRSSGQKYILSKKHQLWQVNTFEYLFFQPVGHLSTDVVRDYFSFMTTEALQKVNPDENHMTSYLSLVLIADSSDKDALDMVRKAKFRKNFALGMRGWADLRFCVVDLESGSVITNPAGRQMKSTLQANAGFASSTRPKQRR